MPVPQQSVPLGAAPTFRSTGTITGRAAANQMLARFAFPVVAGSRFGFATVTRVQVVDTAGVGVNLLLRVGINFVNALAGGDLLVAVPTAPLVGTAVAQAGAWSMDEGTIITGAPDANSEIDLFMLDAGGVGNPASVTRRYPDPSFEAAPSVAQGAGVASGHLYIFSALAIPLLRTYELTVTWVIG